MEKEPGKFYSIHSIEFGSCCPKETKEKEQMFFINNDSFTDIYFKLNMTKQTILLN